MTRTALAASLLALFVALPASADDAPPDAGTHDAAKACVPKPAKLDKLLPLMSAQADDVSKIDVPTWTNLSHLRLAAQDMVDAADEIECHASAAEVSKRAGAIAVALRARDVGEQTIDAIGDEETCRASDACMAKRVCDATAVSDDAKGTVLYFQQQIAAERSNPAGVVDLRVLHDLGAGLQTAQANAKAATDRTEAMKKWYAFARKKPFKGACSSP